jgi:hypothetical protein
MALTYGIQDGEDGAATAGERLCLLSPPQGPVASWLRVFLLPYFASCSPYSELRYQASLSVAMYPARCYIKPICEAIVQINRKHICWKKAQTHLTFLFLKNLLAMHFKGHTAKDTWEIAGNKWLQEFSQCYLSCVPQVF